VPGAAIFGCLGHRLSAAERAFFRDADPFGFILFARNLDHPAQISALTAELRDAVGRQAPILIDQEGGRVARLRPPIWRDWLTPMDQVASSQPGWAARGMYLRYRLIADELLHLGIDTNCAPMVDVPGKGVHDIILSRCYGREPAKIAVVGRAVAEGLLAGGVLPVLKHIPGHGRPNADSHVELPRTDAPRPDLEAVDFLPFRALADLPMAMTAHVVYGAIDPERCATQSPDVIGVIRRDIGFDGLLMSDDISMHALSGNFRDRSRSALDAGCDVILSCNGVMTEMREIAAEAGRLDGPSLRRADRVLAARRKPDEIEPSALLAELAGLFKVGRDDPESAT